ncbi:MAG: RecQ family ATP-dependent DNA helicase [Ardenticatenaceae bacterium]|nr:RecQ family ATP-dependent DNA helicase [Ardenticatenaceae bacterium]
MPDNALRTALQHHFGFEDFRPGQLAAMRPILAGRDTLVVMPTGAGKSLCYQLPALLKPGTTVVLSPLIALMKDQVDALAARGIPATYINSSLDGAEQSARLDGLARGAFRLLYIAPERLRNIAFRDVLSQVSVALLAVDEAHCVSQWGHDFRPDYLAICNLLPAIGRPPVVALTATATPQVQADIIHQLALEQPERLVTGFNRPNLHFEVRFTPGETRKQVELRALLASFPPDASGVIYVGRRREAEEVADLIRSTCGRPCLFYHAGLRPEERTRVQDDFMSSRCPVVVATNAFGMGVDKPDVRFVIHYTIPGTVEAYYQEAGRAGRDGNPAHCLVLFDPSDARLHEWFIENDAPGLEELRRLYRHVRDRAVSASGIVSGTSEDFAATLRLQSETKVRVGLKLLVQTGLLEELGEWAGQGHWQLLPVRGPVDMQTPLGDIERRRKHKRRQLSEMLNYCQGTTCRRQFLLDYFGDATPPIAERCCDNCSRTVKSPTASVAATERERRPLVILRTVAMLKWNVGRVLLSRIVKGGRSTGMERYFEQETFGLLSHLRRSDIQQLVDALIREGCLALEGAARPVVVLTRRGQEALRQNLAIALDEADAPSQSTRPARGATVEETRTLLAAGLSPAEIADQRALTIGTIYNHLASLIEQNRIPVEVVVADDVRARIVAAWESCNRAFYLSPIKDALPEEISYGEIRCVLAALKTSET